MNGRRKLIALGGVAVGSLLFARTSWGQAVPNCEDTTMFPNPVYLVGSTAYQPTARTFAIKLAALTGADQLTVIYQNGFGSCAAPDALLNDTMLTGTAQAIYAEGPNYATDPTNVTASNCALNGMHTADVGISDIFWPNCPGVAAQPATIKDFQGPAQAMILVVPSANTTFTAMSAEMGQLIWGCGQGGMVSPFTDNLGIMQRNSGSGTQGIVAKAINVPPTAFYGVMNAGGGNMLTSLANYAATGDPNKAIGFLAGDAFDQNRTALNPVAFQGFNQTQAFYADSTKDAKDRRNLRDGHYVVWGPEHFFAKVDASGAPTSPAAAKFLGSQDGTMYQSAFDFVLLQALAGVVPQCAMKVKRLDDGGPVMPNTVTNPCGCYYEFVRTGATTCTPCPNGNECTGGTTCNYGYCE